jgi:hypothetical protein
MNGVLTKGEKRYFMTLIDDATKLCYVYLLRTKDEALDYFKIYKSEVENQLERKIKRLRSDRVMDCKYSSLGTPRGRYDEHSSKSSLSCETKVYRTSRRKPNFRR